MNLMPIAFNTFRESIRDKVLYIILVFSVIIISASIILSKLSLGQDQKVIVDLGLSAISIFGVLLTLFVGTSLLHKEIEKKTIYLLLTKPMRRSEFILGKHFGLSLTLMVVTGLMSLCFYSLLVFTGLDYSPLYLQAIFLNYMELILLIAFAILFSTFAPPTMSSVYTLCVYIIGHFSRDLLNFGRMSENEMLIKVTQLIYYIMPDLEKLNLKNLVLYSPDGINPEIFTGGIIYALLYSSAVIALAILVFEYKEF